MGSSKRTVGRRSRKSGPSGLAPLQNKRNKNAQNKDKNKNGKGKRKGKTGKNERKDAQQTPQHQAVPASTTQAARAPFASSSQPSAPAVVLPILSTAPGSASSVTTHIAQPVFPAHTTTVPITSFATPTYLPFHPPVTEAERARCMQGACDFCNGMQALRYNNGIRFPAEQQTSPVEEEEEDDDEPSFRQDNASFDLICELQDREQSLLHTNKGLRNTTQQVKANQKSLKANNKSLQADNKALQKSASNLSRNYTMVSRDNAELKGEVSRLQRTCETLRNELEKAQAELGQAQRPIHPAPQAAASGGPSNAAQPDDPDIKSEPDDDMMPSLLRSAPDLHPPNNFHGRERGPAWMFGVPTGPRGSFASQQGFVGSAWNQRGHFGSQHGGYGHT